MIEVMIDSVRVSLASQSRLVVLKELEAERYLPIWIGPYEADAITIELQGMEVPRPLTHDLLKSALEALGAAVSHVVVNDLRNDTFLARIILDVNGRGMELDSRPSDAIALAVRTRSPIFVAEHVLDLACISPAPEIVDEDDDVDMAGPEDQELSAFHDLMEDLDLDFLDDEEDDSPV